MKIGFASQEELLKHVMAGGEIVHDRDGIVYFLRDGEWHWRTAYSGNIHRLHRMVFEHACNYSPYTQPEENKKLLAFMRVIDNYPQGLHAQRLRDRHPGKSFGRGYGQIVFSLEGSEDAENLKKDNDFARFSKFDIEVKEEN